MNNIITLRTLVELIARKANIDQAMAEKFVSAFTAAVRDGLKAGEQVKVKGIGTFVVSPDTGRIVFLPDAELAAQINSPFGFFQPETLAPGVTEDILETTVVTIDDVNEEPDSELGTIVEETPTEPVAPTVEEQSSSTETLTESIAVSEPGNEPEPVKAVEPVVATEEIVEPVPTVVIPTPPATEDFVNYEPSQPVDPKDQPYASPSMSHSYHHDETESTEVEQEPVQSRPAAIWLVWAAVVGLLVGFAIGYFIHDPIEQMFEPSLAEDYVEPEDEGYEYAAEEGPVDEVVSDVTNDNVTNGVKEANEVAEVAIVEPEPAVQSQPTAQPQTIQGGPVYDEIRAGQNLAALAKKHYGVKDYWIYIYLENKDKIKNPNNVGVGTKLVIPPLAKYIDPNAKTDEECVATARNKAAEVLKQFK